MAKLNTMPPAPSYLYSQIKNKKKGGPAEAAKQVNNLFNLKSFNELKKDQTKIRIFKNSSFDSNFNSLQSLNFNLSHSSLLLHSSPLRQQAADPFSKPDSPPLWDS